MPLLTDFASIGQFISEYYPEKNYAYAENVLFFGRFMNSGDAFRTFLKFEIGALKKYPISITSACLQLYICRNEILSGTIEASIYRVSSIWDLTLLNWNNQPPAHPIPEQTFIIPARWEGMIMIELSATVKAWANGDTPNYGLMIKGNENSNSLISIRSNMHKDPAHHPQLKVLLADQG